MATRKAPPRPIGLLELAQRIRTWRLSDDAEPFIELLCDIESAIRVIVGDVPGICRICGCTELSPCAGGCAWADPSLTVCTSVDCLTEAGYMPPPRRRRARARGRKR